MFYSKLFYLIRVTFVQTWLISVFLCLIDTWFVHSYNVDIHSQHLWTEHQRESHRCRGTVAYMYFTITVISDDVILHYVTLIYVFNIPFLTAHGVSWTK